MLSRGRDQGTSGSKPPAPRGALAQQLFPSSSPGASDGNIRDQFKKLGQTGHASARVAHPPTKPVHRRPVDLMPSNGGIVSGQLQSLCGNRGSFKPEMSSFVDLTRSDAGAKTTDPVDFYEDDFSDDANLDLDYEAPMALPVLPPSKVLTQESMPPPPALSHHSGAPISWSSSPASHLLPPRPPQSPPYGASASTSLLKRESSGENESSDKPATKKAKKRVLPASFRQDEHVPQVQVVTPAPKSRSLWDTSASAIKEQKKQLKNHRSQRVPEGGNPPAEEAALAAKPVAISLSGEQRQVLDLVVNKKASVFFTGPAGAGKSVLMRAIISELKQKYARDPEGVAVTASTGLAACNIGGITLHSFSGTSSRPQESSTSWGTWTPALLTFHQASDSARRMPRPWSKRCGGTQRPRLGGSKQSAS